MANIFEKNKTYLGDCLELMPQMESGMFDMILCDLPYQVTGCKWDTIIPFDKLWEQYERLIKPNGAIVLTASQPFASALVMSNLKLFRYEWIWDKVIPTGFTMANYRPMTNHENILVFSKGKMTYTPNGGYIKFNPQKTKRDKPIKGYAVKSTFLNKTTLDKTERIYDEKFPMSIIQFKKDKTRKHTSQKPVALFEYLIKSYSDENDLILDNCAGGGTTGEACFNTGRNYIQIEKEQKYFDLILGREKSFNKKDYEQESLFGGQI